MRNARVACLALVVAGALWGCAPLVGSKEPPAPAPKVGQWGFVGELTVTRPDTEIKNTNDKEIYLNERYSLTDYRIVLPNGSYVVTLHFAETYEGIKAAGERVFSVAIEGKPVLTDFDVYQEAGGQPFCAVVKEFGVEVADGELTISFQAKVQNPMINGIEVAADRKAQRLELLRINCAGQKDYTDAAGNVWEADQAFPAAPKE